MLAISDVGMASIPKPPQSNLSLSDRAYHIRRHALRMGEVQGQGYIAQALGIADVLAVSYFHAMNYRPEDPEWEDRDELGIEVARTSGAVNQIPRDPDRSDDDDQPER